MQKYYLYLAVFAQNYHFPKAEPGQRQQLCAGAGEKMLPSVKTLE